MQRDNEAYRSLELFPWTNGEVTWRPEANLTQPKHTYTKVWAEFVITGMYKLTLNCGTCKSKQMRPCEGIVNW